MNRNTIADLTGFSLVALAKLALVIATVLWTCGCTVIYERGQKVLVTGANIDGLNFRTPRGTVLTAGKVDHAIIHRTLSDAAPKIGAAVATSGILGVLKP